MASDRNRLVEEVLGEARRLPPEARRRFVQERCADSELEARVLSLLGAAPADESGAAGVTLASSDTLEVPPISLSDEGEDTVLERLSHVRSPQDRYRCIGEIARGGMGAILRVRDGILRRDLAMKVILGEGDGPAPTSRDADAASLARLAPIA